jgi:hypothetical protein
LHTLLIDDTDFRGFDAFVYTLTFTADFSPLCGFGELAQRSIGRNGLPEGRESLPSWHTAKNLEPLIYHSRVHKSNQF